MQWYISDNWQDVKYNLVSIELSNVWLFAYFIEVSMALWGEMLPAPALTEGFMAQKRCHNTAAFQETFISTKENLLASVEHK